MLAPALVEDLEHDVALDLLGGVHAAGILLALGVVERHGVLDHERRHVLAVLVGVEQIRGEPRRVVVLQLGGEGVEVPLLGELALEALFDDRTDSLLDHLDGGVVDVLTVDHLLASAVHHLALLVHHLVVLQHVLANLGVAPFDGGLGPLDGLGDHLRLDRDVVGHRAVHDPRHRPGREEAQQLVLE